MIAIGLDGSSSVDNYSKTGTVYRVNFAVKILPDSREARAKGLREPYNGWQEFLPENFRFG